MSKYTDEDKLMFLEAEELSKVMEEMAGAPKEEYGKRTPGELSARGIYEKRRLSKGLEI